MTASRKGGQEAAKEGEEKGVPYSIFLPKVITDGPLLAVILATEVHIDEHVSLETRTPSEASPALF